MPASKHDFPEIDREPPLYFDGRPLHAAPRRREPIARVVTLLVLTFLSTTAVGAFHWLGFMLDFGQKDIDFSPVQLAVNGLWYSLSVLAILGAHEMGHYLACRHYRVDASLPYFLPLPPPFPTGTLGAFIRIRQAFRTKRELFDIGIAGPIAGFVVAVPLLFIGMSLSRVVPFPTEFQGVELGEPLLFKAAMWLRFGTPDAGYSVNMHPMAFAAWFGLLATALNLFPIGQLDGGHIAYAVLGRKSTAITLVMVVCLVGLTFVSRSWIVWTVLTVSMLFAFGPRHPQIPDEDAPLDRGRILLAIFAAVMFALCFTPAPMELLEIVGK
jgi:membrane-associated protease RseP (regulator of RpoE activity)